ncbi:MAG: ArsR/SmtB family transcription factor [Candidatus Methylomirabilales bacterium]
MLGDPTRRAILARLREGGSTVTALAEPFDMSLNAVSKHIRALEQAGLIRREIRGREHHCFLEPTPLQRAAAWMEDYRTFWGVRLDALDSFLRRKRPIRRGRSRRGSRGRKGEE